MTPSLKFVLPLLSLALLVSSPAMADGDEILGPPSLPSIQPGSGIVTAGVGLVGDIGVLQPGDINIDVPGNPVQVLLYWSGRWRNANAPLQTSITVDGQIVTGPRIGFSIFEQIQNDELASYRQDITDLGLVTSGPNTLTISGPAYATFFTHGAGVLVIFDDGSSDSIDILDGFDGAYRFAAELEEQVTVPRTVTFDSATSDRTGKLSIFVTEVGDFFDAGRFRTNTVRVVLSDGTELLFVDDMQSDDGPVWDTFTRPIDIPAGVNSATVDLISDGSDPASLGWIASTFTVEDEDPICGDGEVNQPGETCDPAGSVPNASYPSNTCRDSCTYCGDGLVNNGEVCDFNDPNAPENCNTSCTLDPICGDGEVNQPEETCDPAGSVPNASYPANVCRDSCTYCGDGLVNNGEACDFNDPSAPSNCSNMCTFEVFQGCTPGYWRQENHFGNWEFYTPSELFSEIFGRIFTVETHPGGGSRVTVHNPTMLEAVWADGGALEKLTSHAASALLNASGAAVGYAFSEAEVIAMFQSAYDSGDFEPTKNLFANANEAGCPLVRARPRSR